MTFIAKGAAVGLALALSLGAASIVADARTPGQHKHPAEHGAAVSAVAGSDSTSGEAHGDAVSAVARSNAGRTEASASTHGDAVSTLATTTTLTGEAKGDAISMLARGGHGKAK